MKETHHLRVNSRQKPPDHQRRSREAQLPSYFTITLCLVSAKSHQFAIDQVSRFRGAPDIFSLADLLLLHSVSFRRSFLFLPLLQQKAHFARHNFLSGVTSAYPNFFLRIKRERRGWEKLSLVWAGLCVELKILWLLVDKSAIWFAFYWLSITLFFLPTQSQKPSRTQQGDQGTFSIIVLFLLYKRKGKKRKDGMLVLDCCSCL